MIIPNYDEMDFVNIRATDVEIADHTIRYFRLGSKIFVTLLKNSKVIYDTTIQDEKEDFDKLSKMLIEMIDGTQTQKIIAVDFDGTLFKDNFPNVGEPIWATIKYIKAQKEKGSTIILWTCRCGENLETALEACKGVGLEFDYINENTKNNFDTYGNDCRKIFADIYIDDKAIHPTQITFRDFAL